MSRYFKNNRGFSLAELLVSISIAMVILSVIIFNQSIYTDKSDLINLADEISLQMFEAEAYGTGAREFSPGSGEFDASYGLAFLSEASGGTTNTYISWADRDSDQRYDSGWGCPTNAASECIKKTTITRGNLLDTYCGINNDGTTLCGYGGINVSFARPGPGAQVQFLSFPVGTVLSPQPSHIGGAIRVISPKGVIRWVSFYKDGHITVKESI